MHTHSRTYTYIWGNLKFLPILWSEEGPLKPPMLCLGWSRTLVPWCSARPSPSPPPSPGCLCAETSKDQAGPGRDKACRFVPSPHLPPAGYLYLTCPLPSPWGTCVFQMVALPRAGSVVCEELSGHVSRTRLCLPALLPAGGRGREEGDPGQHSHGLSLPSPHKRALSLVEENGHLADCPPGVV